MVRMVIILAMEREEPFVARRSLANPKRCLREDT